MSAARGEIARGKSSGQSEGHHPNEPQCCSFFTAIPWLVYVVLSREEKEEVLANIKALKIETLARCKDLNSQYILCS